MTEKLYYKDAYIKEFSACVLACDKCEKGYLTVLDKTAFFPEEGGQYSDSGYIGASRVLSAYEKDGIIYHLTDSPLCVRQEVDCKIDFDERYEKMQCHTAEHILSGIIHSMFGLNNVGFHLGADEVTMDVSAPLSASDLAEVERLANEVVYQNAEVETLFPSPEEAKSMEYRSKIDILENLRVVKIGEVDSCACCAPHVKRTGEIGIIKILDFVGLRGGIRIRITAGRRAYKLFGLMFSNLAEISRALSVPKTECADAVLKYVSASEAVRAELKAVKLSYFEREADMVESTDGSLILSYDGAEIEALRAFANKAISKVGGILVLLSSAEEDIKYVLASRSVDLKSEIKKINAALNGRGGGSAVMAQGSFKSSLPDIERYFKENY